MKKAVLLWTVLFVAVAYARQEARAENAEHLCPMTAQESTMKHDRAAKHEEMMRHGQTAMGFDQSKTTHHFRLRKFGGSVEVETNDALDAGSREQVRHHLQMIAKSFAEGDFSSPMLTHSQAPPGVAEMRRLKRTLSYKYVETERGGKVVISSDSLAAIKSVHEFLRFQIEEHQTGDSESIQK